MLIVLPGTNSFLAALSSECVNTSPYSPGRVSNLSQPAWPQKSPSGLPVRSGFSREAPFSQLSELFTFIGNTTLTGSVECYSMCSSRADSVLFIFRQFDCRACLAPSVMGLDPGQKSGAAVGEKTSESQREACKNTFLAALQMLGLV